jgi:sulfur carrier protein ThiS
MKIVVKFHTVLRSKDRNLDKGQAEYEISEGSTIEDLLKKLNIVINPEDLLLAVNGRTAFHDHVLEEGDRVDLIPAISGG